jgi:hypothetical protein
MMRRFSFSWSITTGIPAHRIETTQWAEIASRLDLMSEGCGTAELALVNKPDLGPQSLQLFSEDGNYVLLLGEDDGKDYNTRSLTNTNAGKEPIEVCAYVWGARQVCQDFSIVNQAFKEFFDTGNVSHERLN